MPWTEAASPQDVLQQRAQARRRRRWLVGAAVALTVAVLGVAVAGLAVLLSGQGTSHVLWTRLAQAPDGAGEMPTESLSPDFVAEVDGTPAGEGGLFVVGEGVRFWRDVRGSGTPTQEGCWAVRLGGVPVEFCEGPLI